MVAAVAPSAAAEVAVDVFTDADGITADVAACVLRSIRTGVLFAAGETVVYACFTLALVMLRFVWTALAEYLCRVLLAVAGIVSTFKNVLM